MRADPVGGGNGSESRRASRAALPIASKNVSLAPPPLALIAALVLRASSFDDAARCTRENGGNVECTTALPPPPLASTGGVGCGTS
jgi:hypothetical protein